MIRKCLAWLMILLLMGSIAAYATVVPLDPDSGQPFNEPFYTEPLPTLPPAPPSYSQPFLLRLDLQANRITAYAPNEHGDYIVPVRSMICSTGAPDTPTPRGEFTTSIGGRWYYFSKYKVYAQYATRVVGGILFHSVLYDKKDVNTLSASSVKNLGKSVSHGCVRLSVKDAKWIYDYCGRKTKVIIDDTDPYRPKKPTEPKMTIPPKKKK